MANIKSQIKRNRQNQARHERNKAVRSSLKTATKRANVSLATGSLDVASSEVREAARAVDKAASKGVVHRRTAARRKSRLARELNRAAGAGD